jgi:hypothetical protein
LVAILITCDYDDSRFQEYVSRRSRQNLVSSDLPPDCAEKVASLTSAVGEL